jgi:small GTP-binding protein
VEYSARRFVDKNGKTIKLQIWDTAGQERYRSIAKAYYKGAVAVLLVFDVTNEYSFTSLSSWYREVGKS